MPPVISKSSTPCTNPLVIYYCYLNSCELLFLHQRYLVSSHWSLSDCKSPFVSRTLLSIVADVIYTVVCMVSILPPISISSLYLSKFWGSVPDAPTRFAITVTPYSTVIFKSPAIQIFFCNLYAFFNFYPEVQLDDKVHKMTSSFYSSQLILVLLVG